MKKLLVIGFGVLHNPVMKHPKLADFRFIKKLLVIGFGVLHNPVMKHTKLADFSFIKKLLTYMLYNLYVFCTIHKDVGSFIDILGVCTF